MSATLPGTGGEFARQKIQEGDVLIVCTWDALLKPELELHLRPSAAITPPFILAPFLLLCSHD